MYQRIRIKFCPRGHDKDIVGRTKRGACMKCDSIRQRKDHKPLPKVTKQFCLRGHDTYILGRNSLGRCSECDRLAHQDAYQKNKEKYAAINKAYYDANQEKMILKSKKWREEHPELVRIHHIKTKTNRNLRVPTWTDWDNILEIERNRPKGMVIDHIIPLQGDEVSGLHVSWNMQYLLPLDNTRKHNYVDIVEASIWYGKILEQAGLK